LERQRSFKLTRKVLINREKYTEEFLTNLEKEVDSEVQGMLKFSLESPSPSIDDAVTHVYVDREVELR
jgi:pyruvate dehydrogenase E1 component alpha subunit